MTHKKAVVLGLGQSVLNYRKMPTDITIGVNDVNRYFETDYLIVIDGRARFEADRLKFIQNTKSFLVSHLPEWIKGVKLFELIKIKPFNVANMDSGAVCFSNNSPFVACCYAYRLGVKVIDVYGVDLSGHKNLDTGMNRNKFIEDWKRLITYLSHKGVTVNLKCKLKDLI